MPRQASQAAPASSSTPSAPKRRASTRLSSTSKRPKYVSSSPESQSGKTTSKQSKYFEPEAEMGTSSHSDADEYAARPAGKKNELWREGVKTGLGPGKEIFIQKPKMRDDGGVPYRDESLHPNTKLFLLDLKENNERQWLKGELCCSRLRVWLMLTSARCRVSGCEKGLGDFCRESYGEDHRAGWDDPRVAC